MDKKTELLVSLGASMAANCMPCFNYYYQKAEKVGLEPAEVLREISRATRIPLSKVYGVVTFYAQFSLVPKGKHTVRVCRGTACHVRGGKSVLTTAKRILGVGDGETTEDMMFTLETVACLGACALAPVAVIDGTYYGKVTAQRMEQIIGRTREEG